MQGRKSTYGIAVWAGLSLLSAGCSDFWEAIDTWREEQGAGGDGGDQDLGPRIPDTREACPKLSNGEVDFLGIPVRLWIDSEKRGGPLVIYWHGTGSSVAEVTTGLGPSVESVLDEGGVVAALTTTTSRGDITSTGTWHTGDLEIVDELVACAVDQLGVDPHRIYTTGCSSGAIQAGVMAYQRSSYVAAAALNSGGLVRDYGLEDASPAPSIMTVHGAQGYDVVIIDFADASLALASNLAAKGGFAVDCDHGGGHCDAPSAYRDAQLQFLLDHSYGDEGEPYADGLPESFPDTCRIIED